jgi:hypothetical protein
VTAAHTTAAALVDAPAASLAARILAAVAAEPGELTPDDVAADLGADPVEVRRLCVRLRYAGHLAPSAWRVLPHVPGYVERRGGVLAAVSGDDHHFEVLSRVMIGPLDGPALCLALGVSALTGTHKRALADLVLYGLLSSPSHLWPGEPVEPGAELWRRG